MTGFVYTRPTIRQRLYRSAKLNRFLDLLIWPVLKNVTDDEYFSSSTRRELVAKFIRNRI